MSLLLCLAACQNYEDPYETTSKTPIPDATVSNSLSQVDKVTDYLSFFGDIDLEPLKDQQDLPSPVSGNYNGKKITLSVEKITNVKQDGGLSDYKGYANGYFLCEDKKPRYKYKGQDFYMTAVDLNGKRFSKYTFEGLTCFDENGRAVAMVPLKDDYAYFFLDTAGNYLGDATQQDFEKYYKITTDQELKQLDQITTKAGKYVITESTDDEKGIAYTVNGPNGKTVKKFGPAMSGYAVYFINENILVKDDYEYRILYTPSGKQLHSSITALKVLDNGLILFTDDEYRIGVMDEKGNIIIPASFKGGLKSSDEIFYGDGYFLGAHNEYYAIMKLTVE